MEGIEKFKQYFDKFIEGVTASILAITIFIVFAQVIFRYFFRAPLGWVEEVSVLGLVWITFLGSYLAFRRNGHMRIEIFYLIAPTTCKRVMAIFVNILLIGFSAWLVAYGMPFAVGRMAIATPFLGFPMGYSYLAIPIAGLCFLLHLIPETIDLSFRPDKSELLKIGIEKDAERIAKRTKKVEDLDEEEKVIAENGRD